MFVQTLSTSFVYGDDKSVFRCSISVVACLQAVSQKRHFETSTLPFFEIINSSSELCHIRKSESS